VIDWDEVTGALLLTAFVVTTIVGVYVVLRAVLGLFL
jgi:hypothetical protein